MFFGSDPPSAKISEKGNLNMLKTLNSLAGKISPTSGGGMEMSKSHITNNNNTSLTNNNVHPYSKEIVLKNDSCQDQPDPDYIKMFVGQVPRTMDEEDLTKMFSEFGRIHQINVLRDKMSGQSKGCCFVTYYTRRAALDAQNALHNIKILPGMHHPIQMKPADSENRNERKLFVGMISKKFNECDVRQMFEGFGTIEECTVLRNNSGQSKGCAFVTFTSKQCAVNAIKAMHHSKTMEGCSLPLVVKFADTQKEKDQKRLQQMQATLWSLAGMSVSSQNYLNQQLLQQIQSGTTPASLGTQLLLQNSTGLPSLTALNGSNPNLNSDISSANLQNLAALANLSAINNMSPMSMQNLVTLAAMTGAANTVSPNALTGLGTTAAGSTLSAVTNPLNGCFPHTALTIPEAYQHFSASPVVVPAAGKQIEGPEGANLFIYHLPNEFTDTDLAVTFQPFGNVISAKVFIDLKTNLSRCFGFVSYDSPLSAQAAIQSMNGFQIGTKRLKVQLKRSKEASRPY